MLRKKDRVANLKHNCKKHQNLLKRHLLYKSLVRMPTIPMIQQTLESGSGSGLRWV